MIVVTKHAVNRFIERFKFLYPETCRSRDTVKHTIHKIVKETLPINWDHGSTFYRTKIETKYGPTEVFKKGLVHVICRKNGANLEAVTCVKAFDPRSLK